MTADPAPNSPRMFLWDAFGANRIEYQNVDRLSEVFEKSKAPHIGDVGLALQTDDSQVSEPMVVGLAMVYSVSGIASGAVRASLRPIHRTVSRVSISDLAQVEDLREHAAILHAPMKFQSAPIPPSLTTAVLSGLGQFDPGVTDWVSRLTARPRNYSDEIEQARVEARDSVSLAAQIAGVELPADALLSDSDGQSDDDLLDSVINSAYQVDLEEELLPLDLQRFDGKLKRTQHAASMAVFADRDGKKVLSVFCVNKKPLEEEMGVDLFYWDKLNDAFTFVQYKRLERKPSSVEGEYEWAYTRKSELQKQLALMPALSKTVSRSSDWRITDSPFWFKFVRGDAASKPDNKVLKGMYVPADWLRLAVAEKVLNTGARGGFRVTYDNARYVGRNAFTHLVSRGLVGTTSSQSLAFKDILKVLGKERQVIVAVKSKWSDTSPAKAKEQVLDDDERWPL